MIVPSAAFIGDTVIATKTEATVLETQQSVSVITNQQIEDQGAQNMSQALRYTAGVTAEPYEVFLFAPADQKVFGSFRSAQEI